MGVATPLAAVLFLALGASSSVVERSPEAERDASKPRRPIWEIVDFHGILPPGPAYVGPIHDNWHFAPATKPAESDGR